MLSISDSTKIPKEPPETEITVDVREVGLPNLPPGTLSTIRVLGCSIKPPASNFEVEWLLPDQTVISSSKDRFMVDHFPQRDEHSLTLTIQRVSYTDEGEYVCQYRENTDSEWISNSTTLTFPGTVLNASTYSFTI